VEVMREPTATLRQDEHALRFSGRMWAIAGDGRSLTQVRPGSAGPAGVAFAGRSSGLLSMLNVGTCRVTPRQAWSVTCCLGHRPVEPVIDSRPERAASTSLD
jgi:hypothetical protein